jgi:nucleoside-diphosphate-sugar epimerase
MVLGAPFVTFLGEALEMRYLWRIPIRLDNAKLASLIGQEPHTPIDEALRQTLLGLGCVPEMPDVIDAKVGAASISGTYV